MADRCIEHDATDSLVAIFEDVTTVVLRFSRFFTERTADANGNAESKPLAELDAANDDYRYTASYIWKKGLQPTLEQIADGLLAGVVGNLKGQHSTLQTWGAASRDYDPMNMGRFSIESTGRAAPRLPEIGDVLIDSARECLDWLASNKPLDAAEWCDRLATEPAPILRRLAIHGVLLRSLDPDHTIDWLLRHSSQYDESARHERIRALQISYPGSSEDRRRSVIKDILDYQWPRTQDKERDELTLSHQFSWLEWLSESDPDCSLLQVALQTLKEQHPDFNHREFPDVDHRTWLDDAIPFSPWKPQELVASPARDWTDKLLTYRPVDPLQPDRRRLLDAVTRASAQNIEWGIDLANDLLQRNDWDTDLWSSIFHSWSTTKLDSSQSRRVLHVLRCKALHRNHAHPIAGVLQTIARNAESMEYEKLVRVAGTIAMDLWASIDGQDIPEECDDWLIKAWSHPAGVLTQVWIDSLVFLKKRRDYQAGDIKRHKGQFSAIVRDDTAIGRLGRCVLSRNLSLLLAVEERWTKDNLLPLVYDYPCHPNNADHAALWDGLLSGAINTPLAQILRVPLLDAMERMAREPADSTRRRSFVECYTFVLTFFAGDPIDTWIPMLLRWISEKERITLVRNVHERLENMNEVQQADLWRRWLRQYWQNRVQRIPTGLQPREAWHMLRWLPLLQKRFPAAVDIAIGVTPSGVDPEPGLNIVLTLYESDLPTKYPESVAKLLIYFGKCARYKNWYKGKELVDGLLNQDLSDNLKTSLKELVAQRGLQ